MPIVGDLLADRYRIDGLLGAGGMASVYRATDLRLDRPVALKVLSANLAADPIVAQRFEREARALAAAAHPSVVAVFDVSPGDPETGREPFYVMELCDGGTLADRLSEKGRLDPADLAPALASVAQGLAELHRRGVVHRDVKPANIVYSGDRPKLADFGLARSEEQDLTTLTAKGMTVGTLAYLAPELLAGSPATAASDIYALGVTAYQGLTGRLPKEAASIGELIENRTKKAAAVSAAAPELSRFDRPIRKALAVDPEARPDADELAAALTAALAGAAPPRRNPRKTGTRSFFDAADPLPATAVSVPVAQPAVADVAPVVDAIEPPGTDETLTQVPIVPPPRSGPVINRAQATRTAHRRVDRRQPSRRLTDRPGLLVLAAFVFIVLALAGLSSLLGAGSPGASPSAPLVVVATSPSAAISSSPSLSPSPIPSPSTPIVTPTPGPAARAQAALNDVVAAIEGARGAGGLKGKEANELERLAADVGMKLRSGEYDEAREAASRLEERVRKLGHELDGARRARLEDAVSALIDAIDRIQDR
jgi:serine/threonine-protein kinase